MDARPRAGSVEVTRGENQSWGICSFCEAVNPAQLYDTKWLRGWWWFCRDPMHCPICGHVGQPRVVSDDEAMQAHAEWWGLQNGNWKH